MEQLGVRTGSTKLIRRPTERGYDEEWAIWQTSPRTSRTELLQVFTARPGRAAVSTGTESPFTWCFTKFPPLSPSSALRLGPIGVRSTQVTPLQPVKCREANHSRKARENAEAESQEIQKTVRKKAVNVKQARAKRVFSLEEELGRLGYRCGITILLSGVAN